MARDAAYFPSKAWSRSVVIASPRYVVRLSSSIWLTDFWGQHREHLFVAFRRRRIEEFRLQVDIPLDVQGHYFRGETASRGVFAFKWRMHGQIRIGVDPYLHRAPQLQRILGSIFFGRSGIQSIFAVDLLGTQLAVGFARTACPNPQALRLTRDNRGWVAGERMSWFGDRCRFPVCHRARNLRGFWPWPFP